jgi:hypothetical protein
MHFAKYYIKFILENFFFKLFFGGIFFFLFVQYSALLHLPPLRFHCADGCRDRDALTTRLDLIRTRLDLIRRLG